MVSFIVWESLVFRLCHPDAIVRDEGGVFLRREREAGRGDWLSRGFPRGAGLVEREKEGERVGVVRHPVGGADGFVEPRQRIAQRVRARLFERAVEVAQRPVHLCHHLAAKLTQSDGGLGDGFDLRPRRGMRLGEGVEDGVAGVAVVAFEG